MSLPVLDDFILTDTDEDKPTPCESGYCVNRLKKPSHPADYHTIMVCSHHFVVCAERVALYPSHATVLCMSCDKSSDPDDILVFPLKEFPL